MKFFRKLKDGGPESKVWAYVLVEIKGLFSIMLLKFEDGSREAYHSHAFNAVSWVLRGLLVEKSLTTYGLGPNVRVLHYWPRLRPVFTGRDTFHKVTSIGRTWVLTFRGPWAKEWHEYLPGTNTVLTLTHGRQVVRTEVGS